MSQMKEKQWGGRFNEPMSELMERLNASIGFDIQLFEQDINGSEAHAAMLAAQGIIPADDAEKIIEGLEKVRAEIRAGKMELKASLEDVHTHVEARLKELIGEAAGKLHTGRSRNDQVALDLRLWVLDSGRELDRALLEFQRALWGLADAHRDVIMPGYTHMQRAQPVLFGHHMLAYVEMAQRDRERLADCLKRTAISPLGAAALAGTTFTLDTRASAEKLGMSGVFKNSLDAVSDRDFAAEFLFVLGMCQIHLSRLAEELCIWSSQEFSFVSLSDAFSTGSSIMPQKKNPDSAELIRGKTGRVMGDLVSLLTTLKGLPLAYNKDMQEDKEPVFDAFATVHDCLKVMAPLLKTLMVRSDNMRSAAEGGFLNATELADYLTAKGLPFRQAHEIAGKAVRLAEKTGRSLGELEIDEFITLSNMIQKDVYEVLKIESAVNRRTSPGGTAQPNLEAALEEARKRLWPEKA
jgi:argininosuccinate lyase